MSEKNILQQILSNTEEVKNIVVSKENEKEKAREEQINRRKDQLKVAQKKFVQIKANVKPELYNKIINKAQNGNVSAYLLKLVDNDLSLTSSMFETMENQNELEIEALQTENKILKSKIHEYKTMNFFQKFMRLLS